ncbi:MAG TPA: CPBP family intramembrane metalloprotease [Bacilli bacterium]|nr:CPBP family intramembrane metalloprotease [Bacilli bacterium]
MTLRYWMILITYIFAQLSGFVGVRLFIWLGVPKELVIASWTLISFSLALIIILLILRPDMKKERMNEDRLSTGMTIMWSIVGIFMVFAAQAIAAMIEINLLGIEIGSENTADIVEITKSFLPFMIVPAIIAPILEEIIFRKIIFGSLYRRFNFIIAVLISSLIFAALHWDFEHLLVYTLVGGVFAFLYAKTKRIIVPIIAHAAVNSFVVLTQVVFYDEIMEFQRRLEEMQAAIGGFFV